MIYIIAYLSTALIFLAIDAVWLGMVATTFYRDQLGGLMLEQPKMLIAAAFYMVYAGGIVFFAVKPALEAGSYQTALLHGALFGFFCYATYDITNMATLKNWPTLMSLVDMIWGTVLTGTSAVAGYFVTRYIASTYL